MQTSPRPIRFDEVADLYDTYVTSKADIDFILSETNRYPGKTLELTCGTGRVSIPLLQAGVNLTCVDYSANMIAQLQEKLSREGLTCSIVKSDITELSLSERFDLILIPFHSFQEIVDESKHQPTLKRIEGHLTAKGRFLCTLQNPEIRRQSMNGSLTPLGRFAMGSGRTLQVSSLLTYDPEVKRASGYQQYDIVDDSNTLCESRRLEINFRLFTKDEFETLAGSAGLQTDELFGDYDHSAFDPKKSPFMIWRLKKSDR